MKKVVDYLKLRGSYGLVGSDGFGGNHFVYFDTITINGGGTYVTGPSTSLGHNNTQHAISGYAMSDASWERVKKLNIGIDASLFNQFNITAEYFKDKRDRIALQRASWPFILGYWDAIPWGQVGAAESHGVEFSVSWDKRINKDLDLSLRGNFTYNQNKYVNLDEPDYESVWQAKTGKPLDGYRTEGFIAEGLFTSQDEIDNSPEQLLGTVVRPGDIKYRDINGDGRIDNDELGPGRILQRIGQAHHHRRQHHGFRNQRLQRNAVRGRPRMETRQPRPQCGVSPFGSHHGRQRQQHGDQHLLDA